MRKSISRCVRVLFGGAVLLGSSESGCLNDQLQEATNLLNRWTNKLQDETQNSQSDSSSGFLGHLSDLFG